MGGSKSKLSGPSNAFLGSDGRPYYEPDPDVEKARCCCIYVARGVLKLVISIALLAIVGVNAAALIAGSKQYFTYYTSHRPVNETTTRIYQFKTGWLRWSSSDRPGVVESLKTLSHATWIMGIVSAAVTALSAVIALWMSVSILFRQTGRSACCCAFPIGVIQIGCWVTYYILAAVWVSDQNGNVIRSKNAPWPSWAWFFCAGAGVVWILASILMLAIPAPTIHVPNEYLQNEAGAARGWGRTAQAPTYPPDHEAARMGVNEPSSAPVQVEEPRLSYTVKNPDSSKKGGFFGRGGTQQPYRSRTEEIAQRYRGGSSADIELPSQGRKAWN